MPKLEDFPDFDEYVQKNSGGFRVSGAPVPETKAGWSDLASASLENTAAGLYGVGEALGLDSLEARRLEAERSAEAKQQWAGEQMGVPGSWKEAKFGENMTKYVGNLAVQSAPQMLATAGMSLLPGGLVLAPATSYLFAASDTLQNQREVAGRTDAGSAFGAAVPYAAVDYLTGGQARVARALGKSVFGGAAESAAGAAGKGIIGRTAEKAGQYLEDIKGFKGTAARTGVDLAKTGLEEAGGEAFQEAMNTAARMGVDPNTTMFGDEALERYKESAIGGGILGMVTGTVMHPFERHGAQPANRPSVDTTMGLDLMNPDRTLIDAMREQGRGGTSLTPAGGLVGNEADRALLEAARERGAGGTPLVPPGGPLGDEANQQMMERMRERDVAQQPPPGGAPGAPPGAPPTLGGAPIAPVTPPLTPDEARAQRTTAAAKELAARNDRARKILATDTFTPKDADVLLFHRLDKLREDGKISEDQFDNALTQIKAGQRRLADTIASAAEKAAEQPKPQEAAGATQKTEAAPTPAPAPETAPAAPAGPATNVLGGAPLAPVQTEAAPVETATAVAEKPAAPTPAPAPAAGLKLAPVSVAAPAPGAFTAKAAPQKEGAVAKPAEKPAPAPAVAAPAAAPVAAKPAPAPAAETEESPGAAYVRSLEERPGGKKVTPLARQTIYAAAGLDEHGYHVSDPKTATEVAMILHAREVDKALAAGMQPQRGPVSDKAIYKRLDAHMLTMERIHALARSGFTSDEIHPHEGEHAAPESLAEPEAEMKEGFSLGKEGQENKSNIVNEESGTKKLTDMLKGMAAARSKGLNEDQRNAIKALLNERRAIMKGEKEGDKKLSAFREQVRKLLGNETLFPDRELANSIGELTGVLEGRKFKAEEGQKSAVEEDRERRANKAQEDEQARRNAEIAAENERKDAEEAAAKERAKPVGKLTLAEARIRERALREKAAQMTNEQLRKEADELLKRRQDVLALLPEEHANAGSIQDAVEEWNGYKADIDPEFDQLDPDLQAHWVVAVAEHYSGPLSREAGQKIQRKLGDIVNETDRRRHAREQAAAAGVPAEDRGVAAGETATAGGIQPEAAPEPRAAADAAPGHAAAGPEEHAGGNAAGPRAAEDERAAADQRGAGAVADKAVEAAPLPEPSTQRVDTSTPEFKNWFGDSKVVDANGEPMVVYHRTASDISEFDNRSKYEGGIYFTADPRYASGRARIAQGMGHGEAANVMPVYVRIENPAPSGMSVEAAKKAGYDGIIRDNEVVAFKPEQIKSAISNTGEFSRTNFNIHENLDEGYLRRMLMGEQPVAQTTRTGRERKASVVRVARRARALMDEGTITADQFAAQTSAALDAADNAENTRAPLQRQRGTLWLRKKLLEAQHYGWITPEHAEFAEWMLRQNPQWGRDVGISIAEAKPGQEGTSGSYEPIRRILTLLKGSTSDSTAVHEILHHLERMMPEAFQNEIRREWMRQLARGYRAAMKGDNANLKEYFGALMEFHFSAGRPALLERAMQLLREGKVPYEAYQFFNPSEFWAINGTNIMQGRFGASESIIGRIRQWLSELGQRIKGAFGFTSNRWIINALNSLAQSDGRFVTGTMISGEPGVHFMYTGENAATQEQQQNREMAEKLAAIGVDAKKIRAATGWFQGVEGKWRTELSDKDAAFKQDFASLPESSWFKQDFATMKLGDVLDHPKLFAAYPAARDIELTKMPVPLDFFKNMQGSYDGKNRINVTPYAQDPMGTLLHEIQHWVQTQEGFAAGGNAKIAFSKLDADQKGQLAKQVAERMVHEIQGPLERARTMVNLVNHKDFDNVHALAQTERRLSGERQKAYDNATGTMLERINDPAYQAAAKEHEKVQALYYKMRDAMLKDVTGKERHELSHPQSVAATELMREKTADAAEAKARAAREAVVQTREAIDAVRAGDEKALQEALSESDKHNLYTRIAGEMEARDTAARMKMSPEERADTAPYSSEDLPGHQLLVHYDYEAKSESREPGFQDIEKITTGFPKASKTTAKIAQKLGVETAHGTVKSWLQAGRFTHDILNAMVRNGPDTALGKAAAAYGQAMDAITANRTGMQRKVAAIVDDFKRLPQSERDKANTFMRDSTMSGKWGFDPKWITSQVDKNGKPVKVNMDETMQTRFDALLPDTKAVVERAFEHSYNELMAMRSAIKRKADAAFTDDEAKQEFLDRFAKLTNMYENSPYLPLKRFGNWVAVAKSPEYQEAEAAHKAALEGLTDTPASKKALAAARKALRALETDENHYQVSFRETRGEAMDEVRRLATTFGENVDMFNRDSGYADHFASSVQSLGLIARMKALSEDEEVNANAKATFKKLLTDFELSLMSEASVRQSERRRKGISGADPDMMRSFGTKGMSAANFIAALDSGGAAEAALADMKRAAGAFGMQGGLTREQRADSFNEISKRHYMGFDYKPSPLAEGMLRASSIFQLLFNPAYHLINALQPLTISAPWLAGRHGMTRTMGHMFRAYSELGTNVYAIAKAMEHDKYEGLPADVRDAVRELVARGAISADMIYEHGRSKWKTDDPRHPVPAALARMNRAMDTVGSTVELVNRLTTAMAAYRMSRQDALDHGKAVDAAYRAIYETHGDYSGFNAPRLMRAPLARVLTQYRKFQFIQIGMWGRLVRDALNRGGKLSADEAAVARAQLLYSMGMMFAVGGLTGLPAAGLIGTIVNGILGMADPDDPDKWDMRVRKAINEPWVADLLLKGIPYSLAGVDLSKRATAGDLLTPLPYVEMPHDRSTMEKALAASLGPFIGGLLPKAADGVAQLWQGNYWKGMESLMPNGFANASKGMRLAVQGMTQKNGDLVMSPDEISAFEAAMQGIGLPAREITNRQFVQQAKFDEDAFYKGKTTSIKHDYTQAFKDQDYDGMREAREEWARINESRKDHGYKPQPLAELLKAPAQQAKREKSAIGGVIPSGKRDAGALRELEELTQ